MSVPLKASPKGPKNTLENVNLIVFFLLEIFRFLLLKNSRYSLEKIVLGEPTAPSYKNLVISR